MRSLRRMQTRKVPERPIGPFGATENGEAPEKLPRGCCWFGCAGRVYFDRYISVSSVHIPISPGRIRNSDGDICPKNNSEVKVMDMAAFVERSTVRIETVDAKGKGHMGTSFFFHFNTDKEKNTFRPAIVTNKHIAENAVKGKLVLPCVSTEAEGSPVEYVEMEFVNFSRMWTMHPDKDVDLCIFPIGPIINELREQKKDLAYTALTTAEIPSKEELEKDFSRIEDVMVIGYPDDIYDTVNHVPVARKGITATPLQEDFKGDPVFLVDAGVYPGSSGSPVFVYNNGSYVKPDGTTVFGKRLKLVGIIFELYLHSVDTSLSFVDDKTSEVIPVKSQIPNDLGRAVNARELLTFENIEWKIG